jgi:biopolymer transport protein ExbB
VAGPVGEALIMTAIGLAVAVPAVLGYNVLLRRNKDVQEGVSHFTHELHAYSDLGRQDGPGNGKGTHTGVKPSPAAAR